MTIDELTSVAAETLGLPFAEIESIIAALDEGAMLRAGSSSQQRLTAMSLTNVVLAAMARCPAPKAAIVVARLREAGTDPSRLGQDERLRPILNHPLFAQQHNLGDALDTIFLSYAAQDGFDDESYGLPITNMSFRVSSPQTLNYSAELWLDNGSEDWTLRYHRNHPDFDGVTDALKGEVARRLIAGCGDMSFTTSVSSNTFYELAEAFSRSTGEAADQELTRALRKRD